MDMVTPLARAVLDAAPTVTIAGTDYALAGPLYDTQLEDNAMAATALVVITPDEAVEALRAEGCIPDTQYLNVMYADNGKTAGENDAALDDIVAALQPRDMGGFEKGAQGARRPLREPLVAGHAHPHGERDALPVRWAAPHDHVPGALHRLRLPYFHGGHFGHPTALPGV